MNFSAKDYREALKSVVSARKAQGLRITFTQLADAARIQKAYLSKVLRGDADLSPDQMFLIARSLHLSEEEERFISLLLEHARSALSQRREELWMEIEDFKKGREQTIKRLKGDVEVPSESFIEYYSDPYAQIVHVALNVEKFQRSPALLAEVLGLSASRFEEIIAKLRRLGLVEDKEKKLQSLKSWMHLPAESPITSTHRNLSRLAAQSQLQRKMNRDDYSVTVCFSADRATQKKIREGILALLGEIEGMVRGATDEDVYQLNLDLFAWTT